MRVGYAGAKRAGAAATARPVAHDERGDVSKRNASQGITERHARSCTASPCTCTPTFKAQVFDARVGKRITKTFSTITAARQWRQDAASAIRAGTLTADRGPTVQDAAEGWLTVARAGVARNRSGEPYKPSALRGYEQNLRKRVLPVLGHERLREVTLPQLQRLVDRLAAEGHAPATITATITPLRAIYRRARQLGDVHTNPMSGISVPSVNRRQERFATVEQIEAMLAQLAATKDRALWATAIYAGLRRGELMALRREDIDLAAGVIHVRRGWDQEVGEVTPKSAQGRRRVPIPAALRQAARVSDGRPERGAGVRWREGRLRPRAPSGNRGRGGAANAARVPARIRLGDDRGGRERQGAVHLHGPREHQDYARPVRPPSAGR
jgi:integrase